MSLVLWLHPDQGDLSWPSNAGSAVSFPHAESEHKPVYIHIFHPMFITGC